MMNFFGNKKKEVNTTVSSTSASRPSDAQTTIVKLRESIANQDKRSVVMDHNRRIKKIHNQKAFLPPLCLQRLGFTATSRDNLVHSRTVFCLISSPVFIC